MRNKKSILIMAFVMLFSLPVWAGTSDQTRLQDKTQDQIILQDQNRLQDQDQIRLQDQDRLRIDQEACDQARLQLRDRLHVSDAVKAQVQERQRLLDAEAGAGLFPDAEQHWAREQITSAYQWGFANGYQDGAFKPNDPISGAEGIIMTSRLLNCMNDSEVATVDVTDLDLNEVPGWAREMIQEQTALRIAAQSQIYGEEQLNRLQFSLMLAKALKLEPKPVPQGSEIFIDQKSVPAEDLGYVNSLRTLGIVEGYGGNFNPEKPVSRAEAVSMLMRIVSITE